MPSVSGRAPSSGSWMSVSPLTNSRLVSRPESRTLTWTATPLGHLLAGDVDLHSRRLARRMGSGKTRAVTARVGHRAASGLDWRCPEGAPRLAAPSLRGRQRTTVPATCRGGRRRGAASSRAAARSSSMRRTVGNEEAPVASVCRRPAMRFALTSWARSAAACARLAEREAGQDQRRRRPAARGRRARRRRRAARRAGRRRGRARRCPPAPRKLRLSS